MVMMDRREKIWTDYEQLAWRMPPVGLSVSQWAQKNRIISGRGSAEPGAWNNERTPWAVGIMDAFIDPSIEVIVVIKTPQSAGTEAMYNMLGYCIDIDPGPAMIVMPREDDIKYAAMNRIKPMIEESPALARHMTGRSWDISGNEFKLDNMDIYFAASNSPAGLASKPIRYLFIDEADKFPPFAGKEANPIELGIHRTTTFFDRKIVIVTTPTYAENNSQRWWVRSDKRKFYVPCPYCGEMHLWEFSDLKLPKELRDPQEIREANDCWLLCPNCDKKIREHQRSEMALSGLWKPTTQKGNIAGFNYNCLFSPWVDWAVVLAEFFEANTPGGIASGAMMNFKNAREAMHWSNAEKTISTEEIKITGTHKKLSVPNGCVAVTCGADYHKSTRRGVRIDYEIRAFKQDDTNYLIDSGFVNSFEEFDQEVMQASLVWQEQCDLEKPQVRLFYIDSGYRPGDVYNFAAKHPATVFATKGVEARQMQPIRFGRPEAALFKNKRASIPLVLIDVSFFKDMIYGWLENNMTEFYHGMPDYYIKELTNEELRRVVSGRNKNKTEFVWAPKYSGAPTHSLDTAVYASAAYWRLKSAGMFRTAAKGKNENKKPANRREKESFVKTNGKFLSGIGRVL